MSNDDTTESADDAAPKKGVMKIVIWLVVAIISIGGGFAAPFVVAKMNAEPIEEPEPVTEIDPDAEMEYIDFDEVVINLSEQQFSRYLKLNFSLEVPKTERMEIEKLIESRKALLLDRINAHFAEVHSDDLKGRFGQNRIRRQMHDYLNEILFDDGVEKIQDILFRQLHVQ